MSIYPLYNVTQLGIIKLVKCYIVLDVQDSFPEIYGKEADYPQYTTNAVKRLLDELESNGCETLANAYHGRWPDANAVALSRAYQGLMNTLYRKKDYERLLRCFVDLIDHPLLLRTQMFQQASEAAYRTYIDGWALPLLLLNTFNLYGPHLFMSVPAFTNFNQLAQLERGKKPNKKDMFVDFNCARSNKLKLGDIATLHSRAMEACIHGREFKSAISVYFNNLACIERVGKALPGGKHCDFKLDNVDPSASILARTEGTIGDIVRTIMEKTSAIDSKMVLKAPSQGAVEKDLTQISDLKVDYVLHNDEIWAKTLMLKHSLHAAFLSVDVATGGSANDIDQGKNQIVDASEVFRPYKDLAHLGGLPTKYHQQLITKKMFKGVKPEQGHTVEEFMELLDDDSENSGSNSKTKSQAILNFIRKPLKDTFMKLKLVDSSALAPSLNSTIRSLKERNHDLNDMGTSGLYAVLRRLFSFGMSGSAAVKLFAMIYPDTRFRSWAHYHLFLCSFEYDMERRAIVSLDRLLECMVHWGCAPEPAMYARFFELCSSNNRSELILKHSRAYMSQRSLVSDVKGAPFCLKRFSRVSFEMYTHMLSVYRSTGRYKEGMLVFKQLLSDVNGLYRIIPLQIWRVVRAMLEDFNAPHELRVIVEQCEDHSRSADVSSILEAHTRNAQMYSTHIIANELESLIDRVVNPVHV